MRREECTICVHVAAVRFGGFAFCRSHMEAAKSEHRRRRQLVVTFDNVKLAHMNGARDSDGDSVSDRDPLVAEWVSDMRGACGC